MEYSRAYSQLRSTMNLSQHMLKEFENFVLSIAGKYEAAKKRNHKNSQLSQNPEKRHPEEVRMALNKTVFEENWKEIRNQSTNRWSLMAERDLVKVDKAEDKMDKFVTMLQVKYGYTRQQARDEVNRLWAENQAKNKLK